MKGHFLHNKVLLAPIEARFRALGATVFQEYLVKNGSRTGFVDLFVLYDRVRIACEAELSYARIGNDVTKAIALKADLLLIVVPTSSKARRTNQLLIQNSYVPSSLMVSVLTLGVALKRLRTKESFLTFLNLLHWKTNHTQNRSARNSVQCNRL